MCGVRACVYGGCVGVGGVGASGMRSCLVRSVASVLMDLASRAAFLSVVRELVGDGSAAVASSSADNGELPP